MTDLDRLIEAVEAGDGGAVAAANRRMGSAARDRGEYWESNDTHKAFSGSLDAAKRLHDALLPGWGWAVNNGVANVWPMSAEYPIHAGIAPDNPARAWLLAQLRAVKAKG